MAWLLGSSARGTPTTVGPSRFHWPPPPTFHCRSPVELFRLGGPGALAYHGSVSISTLWDTGRRVATAGPPCYEARSLLDLTPALNAAQTLRPCPQPFNGVPRGVIARPHSLGGSLGPSGRHLH